MEINEEFTVGMPLVLVDLGLDVCANRTELSLICSFGFHCMRIKSSVTNIKPEHRIQKHTRETEQTQTLLERQC